MTITEIQLYPEEVLGLLNKADKDFVPSLSETMDLIFYSEKWSCLARKIVALEDETIIGSIFFYFSEQSNTVYIPFFWTDKRFQRKGVGKGMFEYLLDAVHCNLVELEVVKDNYPAIAFYNRMGFILKEDRGSKQLMGYVPIR